MMNNTTIYASGKLYNEFKQYDKITARVNVDSSTYEKINEYIKNGGKVFVTVERFARVGGKYSRRSMESETRCISAREYACIMSSIGLFKSRCTLGYTYLGHIPVKITDYSPDKSCKLVRTFKFER